MTSANVLAYFRGDCKTRIVADAGPDGLGVAAEGRVESSVIRFKKPYRCREALCANRKRGTCLSMGM